MSVLEMTVFVGVVFGLWGLSKLIHAVYEVAGQLERLVDLEKQREKNGAETA